MDEGKEREVLYTFKRPMEDVPKFGVFNSKQDCFVVTSAKSVFFVNVRTKEEVDIGTRECVADIQNITVSSKDDEFFVLANKRDARLGYYLFRVKIDDPGAELTKDADGLPASDYLIRWENKLQIANCDIQMLQQTKGKEERDKDGNIICDLVVSYKCIGINTYNVFVFCLNTRLIKFWHESFQLWESPVKGFLLPSNDFLIISNQGINVIAIGDKEARVIEDAEKFKRKIHSLGSCNYLKVEPEQHILFACQYYENRQICI